MDNKTPIIWEGFEYQPERKSDDWYWALGILALAGAGAALIFGNILFAMLIVIASATLAVSAAKRPTSTRFELNDRGIIVDTTLYPFSTLQSFNITHSPSGEEKLIVKSKKTLMPFIIIPLSAGLESQIEARLTGRLAREDHEEPLSHKIMEWFGF